MVKATYPGRDRIKKSEWIALIALLFFSVWIYEPSLHYDFIRSIDDDWLILNNPALKELSWKQVRFFFLEDQLDCFYFPLVYISLSIDVHFFGLDPFWMKCHNLLYHLLSGVMVYALARKLSGKPEVALLTTALFLLHPLQVESVAWAICRRQVLMQFYSLGFISLWIRWLESRSPFRAVLWLFMAWLAFVIALLSKFISVVMLPVACLYAWTFYRGTYPIERRLWFSVLPFVAAIAVIYGFNLKAAQNNFILQDFHFSFLENVVIALSSFGIYIKQVFWPFHLSLFYPVPLPGQVLNSMLVGYAFLTLLLLGGWCWLLLKKRGVSFWALSWYFGGIALTANIMWVNSDLPFTVADRHFHLAAFGLFLFLANGLSQMGIRKTRMLSLTLLVALGLGLQTSRQLRVWQNSITLLENNWNNYPQKEVSRRLTLDYFQHRQWEKCRWALYAEDQLPEQLTINNPYYSRVDLAAISLHFGDTLRANQILRDALLADLETRRLESEDWQRAMPHYPPFHYKNYEGYKTGRNWYMRRYGLKKRPLRL